MAADLNTRLLSAVSRSFYLSLRFLPREFRQPLSTAYLLARATDSVADTAVASGERRLEVLSWMGEALDGNECEERLLSVMREELLPDQTHEGERELLGRFDEVLEQFRKLSDGEKELVRQVMGKIIRGQSLDLERFDCENSRGTVEYAPGVLALGSEEDLMEYTYLVAGCVGEFWTELGCLVYGEDYSKEAKTQMLEWGRHYGQALQLINILRDVKEDEERGRRYLSAGMEGFSSLFSQARLWLGEGLSYTEALNGKRLRFATGLPALIGVETLSLLEKKGNESRIKVSRRHVYSLVWQSILFSRRPGAWREAAIRAGI